MTRRMSFAGLATILACLMLSQPLEAQVKFGDKWEFDAANKRWKCKYTYANNKGGTSTQYVIWYPDDPDTRGYYYFTTSDHKAYWGRCVCPANPAFNPKVMQWAKLKTEPDMTQTWKDLTKGECPPPGDSKNSDTDQIDKLPPPPK